jgi:hypothetical protein
MPDDERTNGNAGSGKPRAGLSAVQELRSQSLRVATTETGDIRALVAVRVAVKPPETPTPTLSDRRKSLMILVEPNGIEPSTS